MHSSMNPKFELQPHLLGETLVLRPLSSTDREALFSVAADPEVWKQHPKWNRYQRDVYDSFFQKILESGGTLAILDRSTGEVIGNSAYYRLESDSVFVGFTFLKRIYWGGSTNRELKRLMLDHAFQFVSRVYFEAGENNLRSRRALEKIGAIFLQREPMDDHVNVVYEITPYQMKI